MPEESKKLILVVDDEPRMIQFIRMNLELEGYRVTQASNGLEALEQSPRRTARSCHPRRDDAGDGWF